MVKKLFKLVVLALLLLAVVLVVNTWRKGSRQLQVPPLTPMAVDKAAVAQRLGEAVRLRTESSRDEPAAHSDQFLALHALLQARFPKVHATLEREVIGDLHLLYTWKGSRPEADPILLMAHQDVVPVAPGTEGDWAQPPYSGTVDASYVWGRGSWDNKGNLMSQLEAIESLIASGFVPERTVHLVFGADEEVGGTRGAARIAALFKERGVRLHFVMDEGLLIIDGVMPGMRKPAALVGVAEKGYMSVVMTLSGTPGHASMPPVGGTSAIGMLSRALTRLDREPMPGGISGVAGELFDTLAPEMGGLQRVVLSNLWLFRPVVQKQLEAGASTNAMLRTTTALTLLEAGNRDNVVPGRAQATVNFRLLPGDTHDHVMEHVHSKMDVPRDKYTLRTLPGMKEASKVAASASSQYQLLNQTIREVFPDVVVAPGLMIGGTDSQHFGEISDHIFKFSPVRANSEDLQRFHGTNERLSIDNYADAIRFYHRLIGQVSRAAGAP